MMRRKKLLRRRSKGCMRATCEQSSQERGHRMGSDQNPPYTVADPLTVSLEMKPVDTVAIARALALALALALPAYADPSLGFPSSSLLNFSSVSSTNGARAAFHWGGTISAIFLLILNQVGRRSSVQSSLLILLLLSSLPAVLLRIIRGQIGRWFAFLTVAANTFFPQNFPVAGFILLVVSPDLLANGLRDSIAGTVFCLLLEVCLLINEIRGVGGCSRWECNSLCFGFSLSIFFLFFFTILYLCLGSW